MDKNLIIIPTYNEALNILNVIKKILHLHKNCDLLIIDDNSPDGTSEIVEKLRLKNIFLIKRKNKQGIGSAHKTGLKWAYKKNYEKIVTMDADGTHNPKYIKTLLNVSINADLVVTNRFLKKKINQHLANSQNFNHKHKTFSYKNITRYFLRCIWCLQML